MNPSIDAGIRPSISPISIALRATGFAVVWWIIAGPTIGSWLIGLPVVALATYLSLQLASPIAYRMSMKAALGFVGYFFKESVRGGWDVASRTLARPMRIQPGQCNYVSRLPEGLPIVVFAGCISLLPGTLCQRIQGHHLDLHVLDAREPQDDQLAELENRIAQLMGIEMENSHV